MKSELKKLILNLQLEEGDIERLSMSLNGYINALERRVQTETDSEEKTKWGLEAQKTKKLLKKVRSLKALHYKERLQNPLSNPFN